MDRRPDDAARIIARLKGQAVMNAVGRTDGRVNKSGVLMSIFLTAILCMLGMTAYQWLSASSRPERAACTPAEELTGPATENARRESLAAALASIASARSGEQKPLTKEVAAESSKRAADARNQPFYEQPLSEAENLAMQKADAHTLDTQLASEEVDPVWAPKLERATVDSLTRTGRTMHLDEVTCRETLCRAKVTHLDPRTHDEDLNRLLDMEVLAGQALAFSPSKDGRNTVLYFSRKGMSLSVLQPSMPMPPPELLGPGTSSPE